MRTLIGLCLLLITGFMEAQTLSRDDAARLNGAVDGILVASQAVSGRGKDDIVANAIELKRLLARLGASATVKMLSDSELVTLVNGLRANPNYAAQKVLVARAAAANRFWMSQLKVLTTCVADPLNKRDLVVTLFPLVVDPENFDQLVVVVNSPETTPTPTPAPTPADPVKTYTDAETDALAKRIKAAWPYRSQKIVFENLPANAAFTMTQIAKLIDVLDFPDNKKEVLALLLPQVLDPDRIDLLFDEFWTSSDQDYLKALLPRKPRK